MPALLVDDFLGVIEAAAALGSQPSQAYAVRATRAAAGGGEDLSSEWHCRRRRSWSYTAIATHSQNRSWAQAAQGSRGGLIRAMGMPTRTTWANSCVAIDSGLGGVPKRSGTTTSSSRHR